MTASCPALSGRILWLAVSQGSTFALQPSAPWAAIVPPLRGENVARHFASAPKRLPNYQPILRRPPIDRVAVVAELPAPVSLREDRPADDRGVRAFGLPDPCAVRCGSVPR